MTEEPEPLANILITTAALNALELAAARREGRPLGTLDVLLGILAVDVTGGWEEVQLQATFVSSDDIGAFPDPEPEAGGTWHNVPLTGTATKALATAAQIAEDYRLLPMPPGVLALGLLAEPRAGAARALLQEASVDHAQLLALVQDGVLDVRLEGLDTARDAADEPRADRGSWLRRSYPYRRRAAPVAPPETESGEPTELGSLERRALARARQLDVGTEQPSSLALLIACIELGADADLCALLECMLLDPQELRSMAAQLGHLQDASAEAAIERARTRTDGTLGVAELIVAVALIASPRVSAALRLRGLTPSELAAQVADRELAEEAEATGRVMATSLVAVAGSIATTLLLVLHVLHDRSWWQLLLVPPIWWGYPQEGPVFGAVLALALGLLVAPVVGIAQAASVLAEIAQADAERLARWPRTGVHLTLREQRHVTLRLLSERARMMRMLRQSALVRLRGGRLEAGDVP